MKCARGSVVVTMAWLACRPPSAQGPALSRWTFNSSRRRSLWRPTSAMSGRAMLNVADPGSSASCLAPQGSTKDGGTGCRFESKKDRTCTPAANSSSEVAVASMLPKREPLTPQASTSANFRLKSARSPMSLQKRGEFVKTQSTMVAGSLFVEFSTSSGTKYRGGLLHFGKSSSCGNCFGSATPRAALEAVFRGRFAGWLAEAGSKLSGGMRLQYRRRPRAWNMSMDAGRSPESLAPVCGAMSSSASGVPGASPFWVVGIAALPRPRPAPRPRPRFCDVPLASAPVLRGRAPAASWSALRACRRSPLHSTASDEVSTAEASMPSALSTASRARCAKVLATPSKWIVAKASASACRKSLLTTL
mmetsp:Transcript_73280/g.238391  ORF Transcript_73280/g.238391 Transcript_73280/m.238391 type:complete len:362 (+) Transcript_73280:333-1418(+)